MLITYFACACKKCGKFLKAKDTAFHATRSHSGVALFATESNAMRGMHVAKWQSLSESIGGDICKVCVEKMQDP